MVSIIILSYNTKDLLKACLDSVFTHLAVESPEVIVVDNASEDDSVAMVKKSFKEVKVIESKKNLGFSAGINLGARYAQGNILLFLNSDTVLQKGNLSDIEKIFKDSSIGVVGGTQVDSRGKVGLSYGKIYSLFNLPLMSFSYFSHSGKFPEKKLLPVEWVNGACFFIKKELFEKAGGFDENFFMYMEDMELCYRIQKMGYKTVVCCEFVVVHKEFGSSNRTYAISQIYKGINYFFKKHKNPVEYNVMRLLLLAKAHVAIGAGTVFGKKHLKDTYEEALKSIV